MQDDVPVTTEKSNNTQQQDEQQDVDLERGDISNFSDGISVDQVSNEHKRSRWTGGVSVKNRKLVRIFGQVGFCAKGMVYG